MKKKKKIDYLMEEYNNIPDLPMYIFRDLDYAFKKLNLQQSDYLFEYDNWASGIHHNVKSYEVNNFTYMYSVECYNAITKIKYILCITKIKNFRAINFFTLTDVLNYKDKNIEIDNRQFTKTLLFMSKDNLIVYTRKQKFKSLKFKIKESLF